MSFILNPYRNAGGTTPLILDTVAGAVHAWFPRKLKSSFTGDLKLYRNSGGGADVPLGLIGNDPDTATFLTAIGANSAYLKTYYDQVGSRDLTQGTTSAQPRGVNAGTLEVVGSIPADKYDGSNDCMLSAAGTSIMDANSTMFVVFESQTGTSLEGIFTEQRTSTTSQRIATYSDTSVSRLLSNYKPAGATTSTVTFPGFQPSSTKRIFCLRRTGTLTESFAEGTKIGDITDPNVFTGDVRAELGRQLVGGLYFSGKAIGLVLFNVSLSDTDRNLVRANLWL